jgi:hypothetical protein
MMAKRSRKEDKLLHPKIFRAFYGLRIPVTFRSVLSERLVLFHVQGTTGLDVTVQQLLGGEWSIAPTSRNRAIKFIGEVLQDVELALYVAPDIVPQIIGPNGLSPIPGHICLAGHEETLAMKLHQQHLLTRASRAQR